MAILSDINEDQKNAQTTAAAADNPPQSPPESDQLQPQKPEEENPEKKEEEKKDMGIPPNKMNGLDMDNYSWGQSLSELNINVPVPFGTKPSLIRVDIRSNRISIGIKNQAPIVDGELFKGIVIDECFWSLEDQKTVAVLMTKQDRRDWWKSLFKNGPVINTQMVEPDPSRLSDLDLETRSTIEKVMFDRKQQAMGLPTSAEIQKQELMKDLLTQHPELGEKLMAGKK